MNNCEQIHAIKLPRLDIEINVLVTEMKHAK